MDALRALGTGRGDPDCYGGDLLSLLPPPPLPRRLGSGSGNWEEAGRLSSPPSVPTPQMPPHFLILGPSPLRLTVPFGLHLGSPQACPSGHCAEIQVIGGSPEDDVL